MDYIEALQNNNLKVTPQRLEIMEIIDKNGHISIDDLYKLLQKKFPTLSLATVYKNINKMCETSFLSEVKIANRKSVFEISKEEHSHVVCSKCHAIMDVELDTADIYHQAKFASHYNLNTSSIVLSGICPKCMN